MTDLLPESENPLTPLMPRRRLWRPACLLIGLGIVILLAGAGIEARIVAHQPWAEGLFVPEDVPPPAGAVPVMVRRAPPENFPSLASWIEGAYGVPADDPDYRQLVESIRENEAKTEFILFIPTGAVDLQTILASGRLPEPGHAEVLAGPLARSESFTMDGTRFQAVGRINPYAGPFLFAYLLPEHDAFRLLFTPESGATQGWLHPEGSAAVQAASATPPANEADETASDSQANPAPLESASGIGLIGTPLRLLGIIGLACAAAGGMLLVTQIWWTLHQRGIHGGTPLLDEIVLRPRFWFGLHAALYAVFFGAMLAGMGTPLWNMTLTSLVADIFAKGELSYIGEAYSSASVVRAALATFHHNYITATLMFTLLVSIVIPGIGVLKTAASFAFIGFLMAPLWTSTMNGYSYHCITMALEFEAYILACFAVCVYLVYCYRGLAAGSLLGPFRRGISCMAGAALWSGLLLACAAAYEAATLILLRF